ncbi:flavin reductase family protein [Sulfurimonas diazotrophicus]|uniref:Flavin reductase family protein n=1 Tax=Sulfurimonas diazotrophicus TaxID=3131939 RepID=A0ABZ3HAS0_9BACT
MLVNYDAATAGDIYKLMSQTIIPRPIAWVVTESSGVVNVAPFSYFTGLSSNPPTMLFSVGHKSDGTPKDTLRNLRETRKCTVCIASEAQLEHLHFSSKELEAHVSETEQFDIPHTRPVPGYPPMIEGAPVAFFCDLYSEVDLGESKTVPLIVEIKEQFVDDACIADKARLTITFDPIARIGKSYAHIGEERTPPPIP